jgi:two-component system cell cycle sensor histidine kinase/response regulator CckA
VLARRLNVLLVEDSGADAELIAYELRHAGYELELERVDDLRSFATALDRPWDIILCDHALPSFRSSDALELMTERGADIPFVIVSGLIGEEAAVKALRLGARDVVLKTNLARLGPVVDRELRDAENRRHLDESEERLRRLAALVEFSNDAIVGTDLSGTILSWNPAAERIYGYAAAEIVGRPLSLIVPDEQHAELACIYDVVSRGEAIEHLEALRRGKSGELIEVELTISPVRAGAVDIVGASEIGRDISERRRAEREHAGLEGQLRHAQKMEAVGRLAGGIAHDFNNLLMVVLGSSEHVLEQLAPNDPLRQTMEEIKRAGERATSLTRQLVAFSRQQRLNKRSVDLNQVVRGIGEMLRRLIGEDIELTTKLDPELGRVRADAGQLEQVIMNLAVNARDAMPIGGALLIETANVVLGESHPDPDGAAVGPGRYVVLSVSDTGTGMDEETRAQAFEPFFTTKEPGKGTGLGLATVYGIVKQSDGSVWVDSALGHGTTFRIQLPLLEDEADAPRPVADEVDGHAGPETILIVEDEEAVRGLVRRVLQAAGYDVIAAASGAEALELCRSTERRIDLVLTDIVLPGMDGFEVARRLLALHPAARTLFMSGYSDRRIPAPSELDKDVGLLEKPFDSETLMTSVRQALAKP